MAIIAAAWNEDDNNPLDWIVKTAIEGFGILPPAEQVAENHRNKCKTTEDAINSVIAWRTAYAAGTGFVTGLGGLATLPVAIPTSMAASYILAASTAATVAKLRGYDIRSDQVRTMIMLCLLGQASEEVLRQVGIQISRKSFEQLIKRIPGEVLKKINQKVCYRLVTKMGEKGVINLIKLVPIAGGVVGAGFDATFVNLCGNTAKNIFP